MSKQSPVRLTREESQEQTRQRLVEAACREVALHGFRATSVRDIAKAAGFTQGAFYSNFPSKEALLLDMLQQHKTQEARRILDVIDAAGNDFNAALNALEGWARGFGMDAQQALLATELHLHAARNADFGKAYADLMAGQRQAYADLLGRLFDMAGMTPPAPLPELAGSLMSLARSLAIEHALYGANAPGQMLALVIRSLFQPQAAAPARARKPRRQTP